VYTLNWPVYCSEKYITVKWRFNSMCVSANEQSDTYFSIMAKHTKDMSAFHDAQQCVFV